MLLNKVCSVKFNLLHKNDNQLIIFDLASSMEMGYTEGFIGEASSSLKLMKFSFRFDKLLFILLKENVFDDMLKFIYYFLI